MIYQHQLEESRTKRGLLETLITFIQIFRKKKIFYPHRLYLFNPELKLIILLKFNLIIFKLISLSLILLLFFFIVVTKPR